MSTTRNFMGRPISIPDPMSPYDVRGAGQYGLSKFNPEETRRKQRSMFQQNIQGDMQSAQEQALASGSFNPELSSFRSTQANRNAMYGADVDLDKYAHEDQYKLLQSLLGIDSAKFNREQLTEQARQFDENQPSWLSGALDIGMGLAGAFLESGGVIPDSNHFLYNYGGYIPEWEKNSPPAPMQPTNDDTLIKAKTGESIMNQEATNLFGADTVNAINDTVKSAGQAFGSPAQSAMPANTMGNGMGNMQWYNPQGSTMNNIGGLVGYGMQKVGGMFQGGGVIPDVEVLKQQAIMKTQAIQQMKMAGSSPEDIMKAEQELMNLQQHIQGLEYQGNREKGNYGAPPQGTPQEQLPAGGTGAGAPPPPPQEQTITIKRKPLIPPMNQQEPQDAGIYAGGGYIRPMR